MASYTGLCRYALATSGGKQLRSEKRSCIVGMPDAKGYSDAHEAHEAHVALVAGSECLHSSTTERKL